LIRHSSASALGKVNWSLLVTLAMILSVDKENFLVNSLLLLRLGLQDAL